jgi:hypothetical protein
LDILNHANWSAHELETADAFAATCHTTIDHVTAELAKIDVMLADDKRYVVELVALLEAAAKLAGEKLELSTDDFAVAACEVFQRSMTR